MVNNTFETPMLMEHPKHTGLGPYSGIIANNVGSGWACLRGVTYSGNAGQTCGGNDHMVSPATSTQTTPSRQQFINAAAFDFHLTAGSPSVGVGDATYAPATDHDGNPRCGTPDAGAYEYKGC
jgi:hypothetical protein